MGPVLFLLELAGSVALLLWGVHMVQTGVQRAFGGRLRVILASALRNRFKALLAGIGVTAALQSSTATGLMVAGFAASGLVDLVPALAVMLGANIGTTLIVQVLSFDVSALTPALILAGVLMFRNAEGAIRDFGRVFIGLGLILLSLGQFIDLLQPYENSPGLQFLIEFFDDQILMGVVFAAVVTWAAHSSVAVVLVIMSFATRGAVTPELAFTLVLGANLGTAINPVLEGSSGRDPVSRRLPMGNLVNRVVGIAIVALLLPWIGPAAQWFGLTPAHAVADFHTAFNLFIALLFFPLLPVYARLLIWWYPDQHDDADPGRPLYLDPDARGTPVIALGGATREALRMADVLQTMLVGLREVLDSGDRRRMSELRKLDDVLDRLNAALKSYVAGLDSSLMSEQERSRAETILAFAVNIEQAGDVVEDGLIAALARKEKHGLSFSREGQAEMEELVDRLLVNLKTAISVFLTEDLPVARAFLREGEEFRRIASAATAAHFGRLREGRIESAETSALHLDAIRDLRLINNHLVAAAAEPILVGAGDPLSPLRETREDARSDPRQ